MLELFLALRDLCLLRLGPQDLPYAPTLFGALVAAKLLLDAVVGAALGVFAMAFAASLLSTLLVLGAIYLLLRLRDLQGRFVQAGTALAAATLVFSMLAIPAQFALSPMPENPEAFTSAQMGMLLLVAVLGCWSLAVTAHILRNALERTFFQGLMVAFLINFGAAMVLRAVLPADI